MSATMEELGLDQWSLADRRKLIQDLYESIVVDEDAGVEDDLIFEEWEKRMIDERLALADAHPERSRPLDEVMARLQGRP